MIWRSYKTLYNFFKLMTAVSYLRFEFMMVRIMIGGRLHSCRRTCLYMLASISKNGKLTTHTIKPLASINKSASLSNFLNQGLVSLK